MREHLRRVCDEVWILDLGGEGRGTRRSGNVFAIQTPVAIAVALRSGAGDGGPSRPWCAMPALRVREKRSCRRWMRSRASGTWCWRECPEGWQAPFRPAGEGAYFGWPRLTRADAVAALGGTVEADVAHCAGARDPGASLAGVARVGGPGGSGPGRFGRRGDRRVGGTYHVALTGHDDPTPIAELPRDAPIPEVRRYAWRSFDRQWIIADGRLMSRPRPDLWRVHGERQVYLTTLFSQFAPGPGPAFTSSACATVPDLRSFLEAPTAPKMR